LDLVVVVRYLLGGAHAAVTREVVHVVVRYARRRRSAKRSWSVAVRTTVGAVAADNDKVPALSTAAPKRAFAVVLTDIPANGCESANGKRYSDDQFEQHLRY